MRASFPVQKYHGHGLLSKLFEDCKRYNNLSDEIALACAIHVVSVVCQRRYDLPLAAGSTQLYQILVAAPGTGKEGYRVWVEAWLRAVKSSLVGPQYRSDQALKVGLNSSPSMCLIIDEIADPLASSYQPRNPNPMMQDLIAIWNRLYNALPTIEGSVTRSGEIAAVERPRLGIFGFTTDGMFEKLMRMPEFVMTGLFSRFQVHIFPSQEYRAWDDERVLAVRPDQPTLDELCRLYHGGAALCADDSEVVTVTADRDALDVLREYSQRCRLDAEAVEPHIRGVYRRVRELTARRMTGIRAVSRGGRSVSAGDARWGLVMGDDAWRRTAAILASHGLSQRSQDSQDILETVRRMVATSGGAPVRIGRVRDSRRPWKKMPPEDFASIVLNLVRMGDLQYAKNSKAYVLPHFDTFEQDLGNLPADERGADPAVH